MNPGNVLETEDAVYFVDWEVAGASDPFIDLPQLGVFGVWREEERAMLLEAYLERPPTEHDRAPRQDRARDGPGLLRQRVLPRRREAKAILAAS